DATAAIAAQAGEDVLAQGDFSGSTPVLQGLDRSLDATQVVPAGVLHVAIPFDDRLTLTVDGNRVEPRPAFGLTTAFDVPGGGTAAIDHRRDGSRSLWLGVQAALWLAVLAVAAGARTTFTRRRALTELDETIIDLADEPNASSIAGEVLAGPAWGDDD